MPFYDYVCSHCGRRTEVMHGIHAEGPTTCEVCGGPLKKALSTPAIVFRGTGWAKKERSAATKAAGARKEGEPASDAAKDTSTGKTPSGGEGSSSSKADPAPSSTVTSSSASPGT